jgi:hypothetical protein
MLEPFLKGTSGCCRPFVARGRGYASAEGLVGITGLKPRIVGGKGGGGPKQQKPCANAQQRLAPKSLHTLPIWIQMSILWSGLLPRAFPSRDNKTLSHQDIPVEEGEGIERLIPGGCRQLRVERRMIQERIDFDLTRILGLRLASVGLDEPQDPVAGRLFCAIRMVVIARHLTNRVHQPQIGIWLEFNLDLPHSAVYRQPNGKRSALPSIFQAQISQFV